jgi:pyochelin biosynthetic protein PchC
MADMTTPDGDLGTGPWLQRFAQPAGTRYRLVCFPHAGGSASFYFPLFKALRGVADVLAVQYPGRQDRLSERCIENIEGLADGIFTSLRPLTDAPLVLFGHSMGAVLAFEVARRLERVSGGSQLLGLVSSGRRAPSVYRCERVHQRDEAGLIAAIGELSGTDTRLLADGQMRRMLLPSIRSDYKAIETYRYQPGPELACPVCVLVGTTDPLVTEDEARAWRRHTTGRFSLRRFPGGHFYLSEQWNSIVSALAEEIPGFSSGVPRVGQEHPGPG